MSKLEAEFNAARDKAFAEKAQAIKEEIALLEQGKHDGFLQRDVTLQQKYRDSLELASHERAYQIRNAMLVYETEVAQAEKDLTLDRKHLKKKMREALESKLEELEEERKNTTVAETKKVEPKDDAIPGGPKKKKPKPEVGVSAFVEGAYRSKKRVNPPHVNYVVRESDMFNDLHLIKRSIPRAQLEGILYDVYASGNDVLVYYDKQFDVGQPCIVADREGRAHYSGVVEVVSPVELKIRTKEGTTESLELSRLRQGEVYLQKP